MSIVTFKARTFAYELDTSKVPASAEYLAQYGYKQSMADCIAGKGKATDEDVKKLLDARQAKFEANSPPSITDRLDPVTRLATEQVAKALKAKGKKVTEENFAALVAKRIETSRPALEAELKRLSESLSDVDVEIDTPAPVEPAPEVPAEPAPESEAPAPRRARK